MSGNLGRVVIAKTSAHSSSAYGDLHRRLAAFVGWIATDSARDDDLRKRRDNIRDSISAKARGEGVIIRSTPSSGSFSTRTGLRRHMLGHSEVEGQDVDVPFVVALQTKEEERLDVLLPRFEKYARDAYPDTEREMTKSSIRLKFSDKVNFDLVPLFATQDPERQLLVRSDGERRETSVQKHVEFIRTRTQKGASQPGRVCFNELVRLFKWWRCFQQSEARVLKEIPSFLVNLLAAYAFDQRSVQITYAETIADWMGILARAVRKRTPIGFADFGPIPSVEDGVIWAVFDPVNSQNNAADKWSGVACDELGDWLEESRDAMYEAIAAFDDERETDGMSSLVRVFGNPIIDHSDPAA